MKSVKKILAVALLSTMAFASSAYATDSTTIDGLDKMNGIEVEASGELNIPTISITVPTSANFILNPFGVTVEESEGKASGTKQILSTDITISNASDVAVDVMLDGFKTEITAPTADSANKIALASAPIASTSTSVKKDLFLYLTDKDAIDSFDVKANAKQIVKASATGLNTNLGTLAKTDGELTLVFDGSVNKNAPWTSEDAIKVTPVFKFVPQMAATE